MKAFHWYAEIQTISFACKIMKQKEENHKDNLKRIDAEC